MDIADVAAATGQPLNRLRGWCATGALCCERDARGWQIPASEMSKLESLIGREKRAVTGTEPVALAVPLDPGNGLAAADVARRMADAEGDVSFAPLAVDGVDYAVIMWPHVGDPASAQMLEAMADEFGGLVLERSPSAR